MGPVSGQSPAYSLDCPAIEIWSIRPQGLSCSAWSPPTPTSVLAPRPTGRRGQDPQNPWARVAPVSVLSPPPGKPSVMGMRKLGVEVWITY